MSRTRLTFGLMLQGAGSHMNAWRHPSNPADASVNLDFFIRNARKAEENGIAFAFVADGLYINEKSIPHFLNRFEPLTILSALATVTTKLGLVGTVSTSYSDPYTIARQFASLDLISGGRAGWNAVTSPLEGSGRNYSRPHPEHSLRYEIAQEYLDVAKGLWDSWDDDAFIRDREASRFFNRDKLHTLNHKGRFFQVEGPLNIQRSPQGQPVLFQAGASESGIGLAGRHADAVFANHVPLEEAQALYRAIKTSAVAHGRSADDVKLFPGAGPIVGRTAAEAEEKYQAIRNLVSIEDALAYIGRYFDHHDFTAYPLDAPFPELGDIGKNSFRSTTDRIKRNAVLKGQTLREAALEAATPRTDLIGSAEEIADRLIERVEAQAADGFVLGFPVIGQGLDDFVELVIPVLEERGVYDRNLPGTTLRDHLGLPRRESRYATPSDAEPARRAS
ncbi:MULTISPECIES: LLM class flavin-dependent oxidoreductase [Bosea]|uniref:LLM class flavin-dependent oxidoreductase n=1 Tax=Bosea TaxID=85413 RepID=UPI00214F697C|nr:MULTISPECIES: LLM class flavin-dependent oxidoreductase [Bosea]MCR4520907.1 LLM class flavin-dependent oxidoreductase [Bosea sp. 47.2.35]MDR6827597.1 FMN-dependent oxidoreductase (nitrilotriacetate monooxygenase family) [Bosea robiniae]MDR6894307.1 FMN-dependent oxidoreductase (nitrilotriacetate monooxygenase family) [Bosea sp. BE109]MDR7137703.1 FMN-dependent oxidoreductase (nitrilotriacetate monooxygenase family) [Bosea sp. BE168]MDR7174402.1 FMN-dependent oxidoreductase (nitrilotriacetat